MLVDEQLICGLQIHVGVSDRDLAVEIMQRISRDLPVLTALMAGAALSQKALTEQAGIEQPTMAATLGRMERDGIIVRHADPEDGRSSRFSLSAATVGKVEAIRSVIESLNQDALAGLAEADRDRLRHLLGEIAATVERALGE